MPVSYYKGENGQLKWGDWGDHAGRKCAEADDIPASCSLKHGATEKQDEIRSEVIKMIEQLKATKFPNLAYKKSIISGFGVGASVASDVAFDSIYDNFTPFGSVVLVGYGLIPGSLTSRKLDLKSQELYAVPPLKRYNSTFEQIARPYIRFNMVGGNDKHFNETSVTAAWNTYCDRLSLDCRTRTQLGCSHFQLMSGTDVCGYDAVKGILV